MTHEKVNIQGKIPIWGHLHWARDGKGKYIHQCAYSRHEKTTFLQTRSTLRKVKFVPSGTYDEAELIIECQAIGKLD
jgi:hypothetical protein